MKILLINDTLIGGGKERRIVQLVSALVKRPGIEVHLAILDRKASHHWKGAVSDLKDLVDYPEIWTCGAKVHLLERRWKKDPLVFLSLYKLVREIKPDLMNVWSLMGAFYAIPVSMLVKTPMVASFVADCNGAPRGSMWWWVTQAAIRRSKFITGNSKAGLNAYAIPDEKAVTIYNGFNFNRIDNLSSAVDVKSSLGVGTRYMVSMAARFDAHKDYGTFIASANEILAKRDDVTFVCLGQGPDLDRCRDLVNPQFSEKVLFAGFRSDVESILAASDLTVLCSNDVVHKEGISNSILESMAASTPVIATRAGGSPEIIEDGESGFLIDPSHSASLTEKIIMLLDDPALITRFGARSFSIVHERFSISSMVDGFMDVYRKTLSSAGANSPRVLADCQRPEA